MKTLRFVVAAIFVIMPFSADAASANSPSFLWISPDFRGYLSTYLHKDQDKKIASGMHTSVNFPLENIGKLRSDTSFNHDAIDLSIRQQLNEDDPDSESFQQGIFAGLRYAKLKKDLGSGYAALPEPGYFANTSLEDSQFTGLGPRVGMGTAYQINDTVGFITQLSGSFLLGRSINNNKTQLVSTADSQMRLVPAWDAKMGLNCSLPLKSSASHLSFEIGYQILEYLNAVDNNSPVISNHPLSASNFNFEGPYVGFRLKM